MKKSLLKIMFLAFVGVAMGYNVYNSQNEVGLSDLALNNIEALARYEINPDCPNGCTSASSTCYCFKIYTGMREVHWS